MKFDILESNFPTQILKFGISSLIWYCTKDFNKLIVQKMCTCYVCAKDEFLIFLLCVLLDQFAPLDTPATMDAFLGYWKPNAIVMMESELWPNLIMDASRKGVSFSIYLITLLFVCLFPLILLLNACSLVALFR